MPTYEYVCEACGHEFDEFQSMSAPVMKKCPNCKKLKLRRKIGIGSGVIFKGGGFYETDYRSDSYKEAAKRDSAKPADSASPAKTDSPAPAKSDSGKSESGKSESGKSDSGKSESAPAPKSAETKPAAPAKSEKPSKGKESKSKN
jgi:putative FmdB family regulatory protein